MVAALITLTTIELTN